MSNYRITKDKFCWMVSKTGVVGATTKSGKPTKNQGALQSKPVSFHSSVDQCAQSLLDRLARENLPDEFGAAEILAAIQQAKAETAEVVRAATGATA